MHYKSAVPQPFLLFIAANLALTGCLGWKWGLRPVPTWWAVQRSKAVFLLTLIVSINGVKNFRNVCITPQLCHSHFLLLIAANLALTGCSGWKQSLWPMPTWLAVQQSKSVFFLISYDSINDMKYFQIITIATQPCHSRFCC